MPHSDRPALTALRAVPSIALAAYPTPIEDAQRLRAALGGGPRLLVKRDDAIAFGFGGNKVRKLEMVAARAQADGRRPARSRRAACSRITAASPRRRPRASACAA